MEKGFTTTLKFPHCNKPGHVKEDFWKRIREEESKNKKNKDNKKKCNNFKMNNHE